MTTRILSAAVLAATLVAAPSTVLAAPPARYVPGEVLVKFRPGTPAPQRAEAFLARAHAHVADLDGDWAHVRLRTGETVDEALAAYALDPDVEWAQPNYRYQALLAPNDPSYGQQWALQNTGQTISSTFLQPPAGLYFPNTGTAGSDIEVEPAWAVTTSCSGVIVAVVDTGVNYTHQDLAANLWDGGVSWPYHGADFVTEPTDPNPFNDPRDLNGHGTHVAGIIGAVGNNSTGTSGVCWSARILAARSLNALGGGTTASIINGINFAIQQGAKVVNMSLGGNQFDQAYSNTIANAPDVLFVVAAGNDGSNNGATPVYPCNFPHANILCVAALDQSYALASFSNYGASSVDVGAPGTNILATWAGTGSVLDDTNTGWTFSPATGATTRSYWGLSAPLGGPPFVSIPADYWALPYGTSSSFYAPNVNAKAWKQYDTAGFSSVTATFGAAVDVIAGDYIRVACRAGGGDPFQPGNVLIEEDNTGVATDTAIAGVAIDMSRCASATSTLGFQLQSNPTGQSYGISVSPITFQRLVANDSSYNTIAGTSMATPVVAGVAAMLRSFNPAFTPVDTIDAIVGGGRAVPALGGFTRTGKAVEAFGALTYVKPPAGLRFRELP